GRDAGTDLLAHRPLRARVGVGQRSGLHGGEREAGVRAGGASHRRASLGQRMRGRQLRPAGLARERAVEAAAAPALSGRGDSGRDHDARLRHHAGPEPQRSPEADPDRGNGGVALKALKIERIGAADDFHFSLHGIVDPDGARSLDQLLLKCQGKSARLVRLDFSGVTSVSSLGLSVLTRWGRVYQSTDRRIEMSGVAAEIQGSLQGTGAIVYVVNGGDAAPVAVPP